MHSLIQLKKATSVFLVALICFGLLPTIQAVSPPPDGGYPNGNTAEGTNALFGLTTGANNTALGFNALYHNASANYNSAVGFGALFRNLTGTGNTATGNEALFNNTTGSSNTADGYGALFHNTTINGLTGNNNTATGYEALFHNTFGGENTAIGYKALFSNTGQNRNTATGVQALYSNTTGDANTACGGVALYTNTSGFSNTAIGDGALVDNTTGYENTAIGTSSMTNNTGGKGNIALGFQAGVSLTTGNNNIDIGNVGVAGDSHTIRIGGDTDGLGTQTATYIAGIHNVSEGGTIKPVYINSNGRLGTQPPSSSQRFKEAIKPMDDVSKAILGLKPVTFRYKNDSDKTPQFGLIAEEVAKVNPDLIVRDDKGQIYTVRYEAVNAMLLNEFLKEHRKVETLKATVENLVTTVKDQASEMQKVRAQLTAASPSRGGLEASKFATGRIRGGGPAPQVVNNP